MVTYLGALDIIFIFEIMKKKPSKNKQGKLLCIIVI